MFLNAPFEGVFLLLVLQLTARICTTSKMWKLKEPSLKPILTSCLYLLILFLIIVSWMYGSLFKSSSRAHNLTILAVDYDGSAIGTALRAAYSHVQGPGFVTLDFRSPSEFPDPSSVSQAICTHGYWGAIYTHPNATKRLLAALSQENETAITYNPNDTMTYIYNAMRYPVISQSYIGAELQGLATGASRALYTMNGSDFLSATNPTNKAAVSALFQPVNPISNILFPANEGIRVLLNTITIVVPPLMQFFFVMAVDHISSATKVYTRHKFLHVYLARLLLSEVFTFLGSLIVTGLIYAFREDWDLTGAQFVETWLCFWFYMEISYRVMDSVIGVIVTMRFAPFFIFTWVIISVTSTLFPFELNPGFYKIGYALPAHSIWLVLMSVWSDGCYSKLDVALPILFVWWIIGHVSSVFSVRHKCKMGGDPKTENVVEK